MSRKYFCDLCGEEFHIGEGGITHGNGAVSVWIGDNKASINIHVTDQKRQHTIFDDYCVKCLYQKIKKAAEND